MKFSLFQKSIILGFLTLSVFVNCSVDSIHQSIKEELKKDSSNKLEYTTTKVENIKIHFPKGEIPQKFTNVLNDLLEVEKEKARGYCEKKGEIYLKFSIKHLSENLLSIEKETSIIFCPKFPSDIVIRTYLNYFISSSGEVYKIDLGEESSNYGSKINSILASKELDTECEYSLENTKLSLFFYDGVMYIAGSKDKICEFTLPIEYWEGGIKADLR